MRSFMCVQSPTDACSLPFEIDRQQCDGFSIYFLPQAPIHRAVYCLCRYSSLLILQRNAQGTLIPNIHFTMI